MQCKRKRGVRDDFSVFVLGKWKIGVTVLEMQKPTER